MIIDKLENIAQYASINPLFARAIEYLQQHDLAALPIGKIELDGKQLYINVVEAKPKTREQARIEAHHNYIDIQIPLSGIEEMGYTPTCDCQAATEPYNAEKDVIFFPGLAESYIPVKPGMFAIFLPQDGHAPGVTPSGVKKIIVKIKA